MRQEKQLLLDELSEKIRESKGFLVTEYKGLTASQSRQFRNSMFEFGAEFEVVRKRVFIKAAEHSGLPVGNQTFQGHVGVIFTAQDPTEMVKQAVKYSESNGNSLVPLAGHIDGVLCSGEDILAIAKLPGIQELRAQFLGLLEAPMAQTVGVVQSMLTSVLFCLEEKSKQSE